MAITFTYAIKYVGDMNAAVRFHTERLGLTLRFQSPEWSEFETGPTTLALHMASSTNPAGTCQVGFGVPDVHAFHQEMLRRGVAFSSPPTELHGHTIARFIDSEGAECSVGGR